MRDLDDTTGEPPTDRVGKHVGCDGACKRPYSPPRVERLLGANRDTENRVAGFEETETTCRGPS